MEELSQKQNEILTEKIKAFLKERGLVPPDNCQLVADIKDGKVIDVTFVEGVPHKIQ